MARTDPFGQIRLREAVPRAVQNELGRNLCPQSQALLLGSIFWASGSPPPVVFLDGRADGTDCRIRQRHRSVWCHKSTLSILVIRVKNDTAVLSHQRRAAGGRCAHRPAGSPTARVVRAVALRSRLLELTEFITDASALWRAVPASARGAPVRGVHPGTEVLPALLCASDLLGFGGMSAYFTTFGKDRGIRVARDSSGVDRYDPPSTSTRPLAADYRDDVVC